MKRPWRVCLFGLVALGSALAFMPAAVVGWQLEKFSANRLRVLNSQGTIWAGQLGLGLVNHNRVYAIDGPLQWRVSAPSTHGLSLELTHAKLPQPVHALWSPKGLRIDEGALHAPASWLAAWGAPFNTIRPEGVLQLNWKSWEAGGAVNLRLTWLDAQSALASIRPLGEYVVAITGVPNQRLDIQLRSNKGPLMLEGQGHKVGNQAWVFNGYASAQAGSQAALTGFLSQMGKQEGGRYRLNVF